MRAHGDSEKVAWGHRIARYAKDVKDLIEALGWNTSRCSGGPWGLPFSGVIWTCLGPTTSQDTSVLISRRVSTQRNVALGPPGCYDAEALAMLTVRLEYDAGGVARGLVPACFGDSYQPTPEEIEALAQEIDKCPPKVRADIMADHTHLDWRDLFPQVTLPVLVCVGRQSKIFPWQGSAYVGEHIAGAKTVFFEHSGHMPFYEEPEKFNQVVREFVQSLDEGS